MFDSIRQNITAIIAIIALFQRLPIWLWNRFFRKGKIEIYPTGSVEIGYTEFGPTVTIQGTLRAVNKDIFARNVQLRIRKIKNNEEHKFDWVAFLPRQISVGALKPSYTELPSGFIVQTVQPHQYMIMFADIETQSEMRTYLEHCKQEVSKNVQKMFSPLSPTKEFFQGVEEDYPEQYRKSKPYMDAFNKLTRLCYWEQASYELAITVNTNKPNVSFHYSCAFSLDKKDFDSLNLNVITMLDNPLRPFVKPYYEPYYRFTNVSFKQTSLQRV